MSLCRPVFLSLFLICRLMWPHTDIPQPWRQSLLECRCPGKWTILEYHGKNMVTESWMPFWRSFSSGQNCFVNVNTVEMRQSLVWQTFVFSEPMTRLIGKCIRSISSKQRALTDRPSPQGWHLERETSCYVPPWNAFAGGYNNLFLNSRPEFFVFFFF